MRKLKFVKLFEDFKPEYRYKLISTSKEKLIDGLKWFVRNFDVTSGFVVPIDNNGLRIKEIEKSVIDKTPYGYETEIGLCNYDDKLMDYGYGKWRLDFIHKFMKKDGIDCRIKLFDEQIKESEIFGTSGEKPPSWTVNGITITIDDVQSYLDKNNIPVVNIPVKDVFHMCAHRNKTEKETLDRSERSSLDFPIIVLKKNGKYHMVLDGHHRLLKAKNNNIDKIKARVFNLEDAPDEYKKVLY